MKENERLYVSDNKSNTIFDRTIHYLDSKYTLRFNTISLEYEIKMKLDSKWELLNINSLFVELAQSGIGISMNKLEILLQTDFVERYNPIAEYFKNLPEWDGQNHIQKLCQYVKTEDDVAFVYHFEKWATRAVKCALEIGKINKHCLILVNTKQNSGKSTFLRFLVPKELRNYGAEDISTDKDSLIKLCKNFIINLDELSIMGKADINVLKSFISKVDINERLPYGRKAEKLNRICSFVGSTNKTEFLSDETGSVRWIVFEVYNIDFNYCKEIDMDKIWAQAYYNAYKRANYNPELTSSDILENEKRNEKYREMTLEQEMILRYFEKSEDIDDFKTSTEIMSELNMMSLGFNFKSPERIGKALSFAKYTKIKHSKRQVYGYIIKKKQSDI